MPALTAAIDELRKGELKGMHPNAAYFWPAWKWSNSQKKIILIHMKTSRRVYPPRA
jgi:hypothetical protein